MKYSNKGLELTKQSEGLRLKAYQDTGGVWTIGYGHTKGVRRGDKCTEEEATQWLIEDVRESEDVINKYVQVPLTQGMFDALVDFVFNLGEKQFVKSTLLRKLNDRDYKGANDQFIRWRFDNGKELLGLKRRRQAEDNLFDEDAFN
jgi:lysozyme